MLPAVVRRFCPPGKRALMLQGLTALIMMSALVLLPGLDSLTQGAEQRLFDTLISHRWRQPPVQSQVVIVDIDEASLAQLAPTLGRWPWPSDALGPVILALEQAGVKAVVLDILFSDRDIARPDSDQRFNQSIEQSRSSFFPMLRLPPESDALSEIPAVLVPGARTVSAQASDSATMAVILPKIPAALDNGRLGTNQLVPDKDGVVRRFPNLIEHNGWAVPSLPRSVTEFLGQSPPRGQLPLLNWRGPPLTVPRVSFAELLQKVHRGPLSPEQWQNRVVVLGSTAPSLFDIKATPMARLHPGVEVLATAVDNFLAGDTLQETPRALKMGLALVMIAGLLWALVRQTPIHRFDMVFVALQVGLVSMSYVLMSWGPWYFDASTPMSWTLAYFAAVRAIHMADQGLRERKEVRALKSETVGPGEQWLLLWGVTSSARQPAVIARSRNWCWRRKLAVDVTLGSSGLLCPLQLPPGLVATSLGSTWLVYWLVPATGHELPQFPAALKVDPPPELGMTSTWQATVIPGKGSGIDVQALVRREVLQVLLSCSAAVATDSTPPHLNIS